MMVTASESVTKKGIHLLSSLDQCCQMQANFFLELNLWELYPSSKEKGKFIVVFFVKFHTLYIVVQWHKRNERKSVMHMQSIQVLVVMDPIHGYSCKQPTSYILPVVLLKPLWYTVYLYYLFVIISGVPVN